MDKEHVEERLSELLTEGDMRQNEPRAEAQKRLSPRYEIRIESEVEPVVEETIRYRAIAEEIDERYDTFIPRKT